MGSLDMPRGLCSLPSCTTNEGSVSVFSYLHNPLESVTIAKQLRHPSPYSSKENILPTVKKNLSFPSTDYLTSTTLVQPSLSVANGYIEPGRQPADCIFSFNNYKSNKRTQDAMISSSSVMFGSDANHQPEVFKNQPECLDDSGIPFFHNNSNVMSMGNNDLPISSFVPSTYPLKQLPNICHTQGTNKTPYMQEDEEDTYKNVLLQLLKASTNTESLSSCSSDVKFNNFDTLSNSIKTTNSRLDITYPSNDINAINMMVQLLKETKCLSHKSILHDNTRHYKQSHLKKDIDFNTFSIKHNKDNNESIQPHDRYTYPGEISILSSPCKELMRNLPPETLAPLHIVLPITLPYGKIIVNSSSVASVRDYPLHHYYFKQFFPSANNLFSRLHGFCNQSPAWLALDVGYIACREHQVAPVVDAFLNFFKTKFSQWMLSSEERDCPSYHLNGIKSAPFNETQNKLSSSISYNLSSHQPIHLRQCNNLSEVNPAAEMSHMSRIEPITLRCSGLRLRTDQGTGWYLYEAPVEICSDNDVLRFNRLIELIENFNERLRELRLCQNATMKPFLENKFAIVVLKQEGSGISLSEIDRMKNFCCEGIHISEIRLVRHKLLDRFGNSMFEKDPRFPNDNVYGRPIACNKTGYHGRVVFARTRLPKVINWPDNEISPIIPDLENDSSGDESNQGS